MSLQAGNRIFRLAGAVSKPLTLPIASAHQLVDWVREIAERRGMRLSVLCMSTIAEGLFSLLHFGRLVELLNAACPPRRVTTHIVHGRQVERPAWYKRVSFSSLKYAINVKEATGLALYLTLNFLCFHEIAL